MMLSLVFPYYLNSGMLALQYAEMTRWSDKAKAQIEIVLVDDGSPEPAIEVERPEGLPTLSIYRVLEDRPWFQHGARNIGAKEASAPWLFLTDMDHVLTAMAADALLKRLTHLDPHMVYIPHRLEADTMLPTLGRDGRPKPHPNSFIITKNLFWRVGGYDEDFCGVYGTDGLFKTRLFKMAVKGFLKKVPLVRYWRDVVPDASTTTLPRKEGRNPGDKDAIWARKAAEGRLNEVLTLSAPYERVL